MFSLVGTKTQENLTTAHILTYKVNNKFIEAGTILLYIMSKSGNQKSGMHRKVGTVFHM
jgi:hypothetical protein